MDRRRRGYGCHRGGGSSSGHCRGAGKGTRECREAVSVADGRATGGGGAWQDTSSRLLLNARRLGSAQTAVCAGVQVQRRTTGDCRPTRRTSSITAVSAPPTTTRSTGIQRSKQQRWPQPSNVWSGTRTRLPDHDPRASRLRRQHGCKDDAGHQARIATRSAGERGADRRVTVTAHRNCHRRVWVSAIGWKNDRQLMTLHWRYVHMGTCNPALPNGFSGSIGRVFSREYARWLLVRRSSQSVHAKCQITNIRMCAREDRLLATFVPPLQMT